MKIQPHDHVLRFRVTSETQGDNVEHVVDLGAFQGHGRCSCQHFEYRILPELEAGRITGWCKHIQEARNFLADEVIQRVLAAEAKPDKSGEGG